MGNGHTAGKVARIGAGVVFAALLAAGVAYAVLLLINRDDQAPSADARRLREIVDGRAAVADADNAYVYLLGMTAIAGEDPVAVGVRRKAYIEDYPVSGAGANRPWPGEDAPAARAPGGVEIEQACGEDGLRCVRVLERDPAAVSAWLSASSLQLQRYQALIERTRWRESIPGSMLAPLPAWQPALNGQRLWLLSIWQRARSGDTDGAVAALQQDLSFWRGVLRDSDLLITKMIAAAAIRRHFAMGNLVLRELHRHPGSTEVPTAWQQPFDAQERSLLRAVAGEWRYADGAVALLREPQAEASARGGLEGLRAWMERPLFQPQATLNEHAGRLVRLADASQAPYPRLRQSVEAAVRPVDRPWYRKVYNPGGRAQLGNPQLYADYAMRIADLEGVRRLALLAAQLRAQPAPTQLADAVAAAPLRDPYSAAPFGWDAPGRSVSFDAHGREREGALRMPL